MTDVVVIRAGCTDYDDQHRIQGALDLPLNERGQHQVQALINKVAGSKLEVIYTSPCESARATAEQIGESLGTSVKVLDGLRNLDQGLWEGQTVDEVRRKYPKAYKQWRESPESIRPPEGETVREAMQRIRNELQKPCKRKHAFAVVVGEPLATLVSCVLSGRRPELARSACDEKDVPRVEHLKVNGKLPLPAEQESGGKPSSAATEVPVPGSRPRGGRGQ